MSFQQINELRSRIEKLGDHLDIEKKREQIRRIEGEMSQPDFWTDSVRARNLMKQAASQKQAIERWESLQTELHELEELNEMVDGQGDPDLESDLLKAIESLRAKIGSLELEVLLSGEDDERDAIVTIHPGAGGTESQDWAQMLMRMYLRWAEKHGYKATVMDLLPGEEAGIKSVTFEIGGRHAFGYLKAESGVHRLVRISPFDANHRRHTSFASVFVYAETDEDIEIEISESDLRIDTFRASGAGGQYVNKTDSAVRITHLPTGIVVQCQTERSQHRNRENAMKILKARLHAYYLEQQRKKMEEIEKGKKEIAWGSQIRSYVLQPYTLVKDHRTGVETGNVESVLDGDIDLFIEAYLRQVGLTRKGNKV
ncbi:MAG: peptide chain release factor 2 [bacterium]